MGMKMVSIIDQTERKTTLVLEEDGSVGVLGVLPYGTKFRPSSHADAEQLAGHLGIKKEDKTYNGWPNYETWLVNLWLTNDQGDYNYWREAADAAKLAAPQHPHVCQMPIIWTVEEAAKFILADRLKEEMEEASPVKDTAGFWVDLVNSALSEVNWHHVAEHFLAD